MGKYLKYLVCFFAGSAISLSGQVVFDFEDDSLSGWLQHPQGRWERTEVQAIAGEGSLHHAWDNPEAGVDQVAMLLQYPDLNDTIAISFRVRHGYPPSSGNNWQLFFLSTESMLHEEGAGITSAMIFGVNYQGHDDHLRLWQLVEGSVIGILDTGLDYQEEIGTAAKPLFRLSRYPGGMWEVAWHPEGNPGALHTIGKGAEIEPMKGKYMGFRYAYSSAQDRKLWLDDISVNGRFYRDTVPPRVAGIRIIGLDGLEISYNEPVEAAAGWHYSWNEAAPDSLILYGSIHRIFFSDPFPNREVQAIQVYGIRDAENNRMKDTVLRFRQDLAAFGDIVINEIMSDPEPAVYLPGCEFVELHNRYHMTVDLGGWKLEVNDRAYDIQATKLPPGAFLVLTHPDCNGSFGKVAQQSVLTSSTALVNGGAVISLRDQYNRLVHSLEYEAMERYGDTHTEGGWSLERADPDNLCGGAENWHISASGMGGTPGKINSHQFAVPDPDPPRLNAIGIPDSQQVRLLFNEPVFLEYGDNSRFFLDALPAVPGTGPSTFAGKELFLVPEDPPASSSLHQLTLENISDCAGNLLENRQISFMCPSSPSPGQPVINEIMYDPAPGGNAYVELFNPGESYYDLYDLYLEIWDPGAVSGSQVPLSESSMLFFPGQYVVFCRYNYALRSEWMPGEDVTVIGPAGWRQLPPGGACLRLTDRSGKIFDRVCYHDSMHHDLLEVTAGVSLERINAGCRSGSQCWTSASSAENYGTPGRKNSQAIPDAAVGGGLEVSPKVFSPDGDGIDDCLQIMVGRMTPGGVTDLYITDLSGSLVRQIVTMGIAGQNDHFYWYGKDLHGRMVLPGLYIIHLRTTGSSGHHIQRKACAVVYR